MSKHLKEEYKVFIKDIEKNIKNKEDLEYIKQRVIKFIDAALKDLDDVNTKLIQREEQIEQLEKKHEDLDEKVKKIQIVLENIENDIYSEEGFDFEIVCPYCAIEFIIDVDENKTEVKCPECSNVIELDWSGNLENEQTECSGGGCSKCSGCNEDDEETQEEEDDM